MPRYLIMQTLCEGLFDRQDTRRAGSARPLRSRWITVEGADAAGTYSHATAARHDRRRANDAVGLVPPGGAS